MRLVSCAAAALFVASIFAVGAAQAFTYDGRSSLNSDGTQRFKDPDAALQGNTKSNPNGTSGAQNGFSFKFSGANNGTNATQERFVPTQNGAFASPFAQPNNLDLALGGRH
jgi:hypothetical protein